MAETSVAKRRGSGRIGFAAVEEAESVNDGRPEPREIAQRAGRRRSAGAGDIRCASLHIRAAEREYQWPVVVYFSVSFCGCGSEPFPSSRSP